MIAELLLIAATVKPVTVPLAMPCWSLAESTRRIAIDADLMLELPTEPGATVEIWQAPNWWTVSIRYQGLRCLIQHGPLRPGAPA